MRRAIALALVLLPSLGWLACSDNDGHPPPSGLYVDGGYYSSLPDAADAGDADAEASD